jgi:ABC-type branched-subunit amino acid transport system ATPase component
MESGAIILEGPTADVAYHPDVINIYLGIRTASS